MKKVILFLCVLIVCIGLLSYNVLPKQKSPKIELGSSMISVVYPGASAEEIERNVTSKIEDSFKTMEMFDTSIGYSQSNYALVFFTSKVSNHYEETWDELRRKMIDLQSELPAECETIQVNTDFMDTSGFIFSLSGENYTYDELEYFAEKTKNRLESIPGINQVRLEGNLDKDIVITVDHKKLSQLGISYNEIVQLLQLQNIEIPSGSLETDGGKIPFSISGHFTQIDDIENTVVGVSRASGLSIRLKDIATITQQLSESKHQIKHNQLPAILVVGRFEEGINIIPVGNTVEVELSQLKKDFPETLELNEILFQPKLVSEEVNGFINSLLQGIILVIVVVFIGLGIRNALLVSIAIPLSIFFTFISMLALHLEVHQISIVALIIALGMLVDNAIVVSDSIQVRLDSGDAMDEACKKGRKEVALPILTATLTTICTFCPLLFLGGEIGNYLRSMPIIVITALIASYFVAFFVTPTLAFYFFKPRKALKVQRIWLDHILSKALHHRLIVLILLILMMVLSLSLVSVIGFKFFPFADTDMMYLDVTSERGDDLEATAHVSEQIIATLSEIDGITQTVTVIGGGMPRFFDTMIPAFPSNDYSQILIKFDSIKMKNNPNITTVTEFRDYLQDKLNREIPSAKVMVKQLEQGEPVGQPVTIRLLSEDLESLGNLAAILEDQLKQIPGTVNVNQDFTPKSFEYKMIIDPLKASYRGITTYDVQNEINIALSGRDVGYLKGSDDQNIIVKSNVAQLSDLKNLKIKSQLTDKKYTLSDFSEITLNSFRPTIKTYNGQYSVQVASDVLSGYSAVEIQNKLLSNISLEAYPNIEIQSSGESESISRNFTEVGILGLLFIFLIYGILLTQFKSFLLPVVILLTVPLSMMGALWGLFITGTSLSFTAFLGMISLAGIVVNNAIILIDYIQTELKNGKTQYEACLFAARKRFRPITLSTVTTVTGLIPLVLMKSELFTPMAVTLMSGLLVSTILTLIIIPVIMSFLPLNSNV